jgi:hypothetical protein
MIAAAPPPLSSEMHAMSNDQRVLRLAIMAAPVVTVLATFAAARAATWWIFIPVMALALLCAVEPDSNLGLMLIVVAVVHWVAVVEDLTTVWSLVAAIGLGLFHTACAAATVTSSSARWSTAMRRRWAGRFAAVVAVTFVAWSVHYALGADRFASNAALWALALFVLTAAALVLRARAVATDP